MSTVSEPVREHLARTTAPGVIDRPDVVFDAASHTYTIDGEPVPGVSSVAKVGGFEESFSIGSAWGFRIGYEGAMEVIREATPPEDVAGWQDDDMRGELKARGLTPWSKRDKAAIRGTFVHDLLEGLATDGTVSSVRDPTEEERGHIRAVMRWFLDFRPVFVATEVLVGSRTWGFSGRYDMRVLVPGERLRPHVAKLGLSHLLPETPYDYKRDLYLILGDLKTSKDVYPLTHFPQLEGYDLAGCEMGYAPTDLRAVLQTQPDGEYQFVPSWATHEDFTAYLGAYKAAARIAANDPAEILKREQDAALLAALPGASRDLTEAAPGLDTGRAVGMRLGSLRKRGLCEQDAKKVWHRAGEAPA